MARIKIESVVERLDHDMKRALEAAVKEVLPNAHVDRNKFFKAFQRAVGRKFSTWVEVPDDYVEFRLD